MNLQKYSMMRVLLVLLVGIIVVGECSAKGDEPADPNKWLLVSAGSRMREIDHVLEAACWPSVDFNNVRANIVEPDAKKQVRFNEMLHWAIRKEMLPADVNEATRFLKDWRGDGRENFVVQYYKGPYTVRIRNQVIKRRTKTRVWTSYWVLMAIQRKDKRACVDKDPAEAIFEFVDKFLADKISSKAQNYDRISNMDHYVQESMDPGEFVAYPVAASRPNIDGVCIWTDGKTVLVSMKERRKMILPKRVDNSE